MITEELAVTLTNTRTSNHITQSKKLQITTRLLITQSRATHYLRLCPTMRMIALNRVQNVNDDPDSSSILELCQ
jgi:hypothetical protein